MSETAVVTVDPSPAIGGEILQQLIQGDIAKLSPADRTRYVLALCQSLGLNPTTGPIQILTLKGRTVVYLKKDATEQLRRIHNISLQILGAVLVEGVYTVTVRATTATGRSDEATGSVWLGQLQGEDRANAQMKAETKAKRRATLSIVGLGFLDESEVADLRPEPVTVQQVESPRPASLPVPGSSAEPAITEEQARDIDQCLVALGWSVTKLESMTKKKFGVASWRLLSERQAALVIEGLKSLLPAAAENAA